MQRLRTHTRAPHETLETQLDLLNPALTRARYGRLLQRFYGFYAPLEARIVAYGARPADWVAGDRRKLGWLIDDLRALGVRDRAITRIEFCPAWPELDGHGGELGCMYVLEGATLGGQIILRHVRKALGPHSVGTRFFGSYGARVSPMWRAFQTWLEQESKVTGESDAIVRGARATFEALARWCPAAQDYSNKPHNA